MSGEGDREAPPALARRKRPVAAAVYAGLLIAIASFGFGRAWEPVVSTFDAFMQSIAVFKATRAEVALAIQRNLDAPKVLATLPHVITVYPILALRHGEQGDVALRLKVEADGEVGDVYIVKSSGHPQLDAAALIGVGYWYYVPAFENHRPVTSWVTVVIRFRIPKTAA